MFDDGKAAKTALIKLWLEVGCTFMDNQIQLDKNLVGISLMGDTYKYYL